MKNKLIKLFSIVLLLPQISFSQIAPTTEGFDDIENLPGWSISNQSTPIGDSSWFQGNASIMLAQDGLASEYIAANHRNVEAISGESGTICNYLIMPNLGNLESLSFYTRSRISSNNFSIFPDRLYVVHSPTGEINPGNCTDNFGDFSETVLTINPDLNEVDFPLISWQQFNVEINAPGVIAFVYYVEDAGFYGNNSNYIGIDSVEWVLGTAAPTPNQTSPIKCISFNESGCQTIKFKGQNIPKGKTETKLERRTLVEALN